MLFSLFLRHGLPAPGTGPNRSRRSRTKVISCEGPPEALPGRLHTWGAPAQDNLKTPAISASGPRAGE